MNEAIPLDRLKEKPDAAIGAVCEGVLLGVAAEGLNNLKSRYRMWGLGGVIAVYGCTSSWATWMWAVGSGCCRVKYLGFPDSKRLV